MIHETDNDCEHLDARSHFRHGFRATKAIRFDKTERSEKSQIVCFMLLMKKNYANKKFMRCCILDALFTRCKYSVGRLFFHNGISLQVRTPQATTGQSRYPGHTSHTDRQEKIAHAYMHA
jgi:hypothetical protein